jgi:antirestriction protein ArdC
LRRPKVSSVYQIVTEKIVAQLEKGVIPWSKPWVDNGKGGIFRHQNFKTKHAYRGVNAILCSISGYSCPYWLTYKQAAELGGQVKKGEKGTLITFWKIWEKEEGKKGVPVFRYFTVFNLEQIEGIEWEMPEAEPIPEGRASDILRDYLENEGPKLFHDNQDRAFYRPATDEVWMPQPSQFNTEANYYQTLYHELAHSTGHESRLKRDSDHKFGSSRYATEELVAEISAAMLMAESGQEPLIDDSAAYIKTWLQRLSDDPKLVVVAASAAEKAVECILDKSLVHAGGD